MQSFIRHSIFYIGVAAVTVAFFATVASGLDAFAERQKARYDRCEKAGGNLLFTRDRHGQRSWVCIQEHAIIQTN